MKPGSKKWKLLMAKVYGIGGAIVILGALFKILHLPGANFMLILGLGTEAGIFFLSAFEPPHEDPDWTLVYPELAMGHGDGDHDHIAIEDNGSVTEQLDTMLADAKIEPELIESLGDGLRKLSDNANQLGEMSGATAANDEFVSSLSAASQKVGKLTDAYDAASESIMGMVSTEEEGATFGEQMTKVSTNLAALNNVYEMQLKGSTDHLEATEKMYSGITELMTNLHDSLDDTRQYKTSMAELSKNLTALNTVYGNMLSAMNINRD